MPKEKTKVNIGKTARIKLTENNILPKLLSELIILADRKNKLYLNSHLKKTIALKLKMNNPSNIDVMLKRYIEQDYIIKFAESSFMINPLTAFKCSNSEFLTIVNEYDFISTAINSNKKKSTADKGEQEDKKNIFFLREKKEAYTAP